jgi:hypothetical protein
MNRLFGVIVFLCFTNAGSVAFGFAEPKDSVESIVSPVRINLMPGQNMKTLGRRLYLPIRYIGTDRVKLKVVFDTGSQGLILDAKRLLPASLVADTGIVIGDKDSLVLNGITVTRTKTKSRYGGTRSYYGNIAYASIVIGDKMGQVRTKRMPFILVYNGVYDLTGKPAQVDQHCDGIAGVSSGGEMKAGPVLKRENVVSPFNYLSYGNRIEAGFILAPLDQVKWERVSSMEGTSAVPLLTLGITEQEKEGFVLHPQQTLNGRFYPYVKGIISYSGLVISPSYVLFDSGNPAGGVIYEPDNNKKGKMNAGVGIRFVSDKGTIYDYASNNSNYKTTLDSRKSKSVSIIGINFFLENSFMLNYASHTIGIKPVPSL